jgi:hypothetical protein
MDGQMLGWALLGLFVSSPVFAFFWNWRQTRRLGKLRRCGEDFTDINNTLKEIQRIEVPLCRRIQPPVAISNDELDRAVDTDKPVRVVVAETIQKEWYAAMADGGPGEFRPSSHHKVGSSRCNQASAPAFSTKVYMRHTNNGPLEHPCLNAADVLDRCARELEEQHAPIMFRVFKDPGTMERLPEPEKVKGLYSLHPGKYSRCEKALQASKR